MKILITLAFCVAFVTVYTKIFGDENSIVGVVVLLSVMTFRFADFGIHAPHALSSLMVISGESFLVRVLRMRVTDDRTDRQYRMHFCADASWMSQCGDVQSVYIVVAGYLLLYGYDVSGTLYVQRIAGMAVGGILTGIVFYRNHKNNQYKRTLRHIFEEFDVFSSRTRWQLCVTLGVSSVIFFAGVFGLPRAMWAGIAAMSGMVPFQADMKGRIKGRIPGNILVV